MHPLLSAPLAQASTTMIASGSSIFTPIAKPIADVLAAFYAIIPNFGVAIMLLSVAWMIVIAPLTLKSTRSMLAMQKLQPELKKLQAEHKNDRQAFAQAQMDLFKQHGVSPFGSCLPTLLPLPVFFALFRVIDGLSHHTTIGGRVFATPSFLSPHTAMFKAIAHAGGHINAFGLDLSKNALSGHASFAAALPFYVLLLIMIGTQYLQTAQMMSRNKAAQDNPQMKFMKYLPIVFGVICVRFPAGVILYYATSNLCRIGQQTAMYRFDPKVKNLASQEIIEVEAHTKAYDRKAPPATPVQSGGLFQRALARASETQAQAKADKAPLAPPDRRATARKGATAGVNGVAKGTRTSTPVQDNGSGRPNGATRAQPGAKAAQGGEPAQNGKGAAAIRAQRGNPQGGTAKGGKKAQGGDTQGDGGQNGRPATNGNGNGSLAPGDDSTAGHPPRTGGRTGAQAGRGSRKRRSS